MRGVGIIYNGISLSLTKTNEVSYNPVFSRDGLDYLYTEITIDIESILNPSEVAYQNPGGFSGTPVQSTGTWPADTVVAIERALMEPRRQLQVINFLTNLVASPEGGFLVDANYGPYPQRVRILKIDGAATFHVSYVIKTYVSECQGKNEYTSPNQAIVSHRFSQRHSIDQDNYLTTYISGEAKFRTDILFDAGRVVDTYRSLLSPPIAPGFRRVSVDFSIDSTNNMIGYDILDRETSYDLGDTNANETYITRFEGVYKQTAMTTEKNGVGVPSGLQIGAMNVKLWGSKRASVWNLTQIAFAVCGQKLAYANPKFGFIRYFDIVQSLDKRYVEINFQMQINVKESGMPGLPGLGGFQTGPLMVEDVIGTGVVNGVNPVPPYGNGTRSYANLLALTSALKSSMCDDYQRMPCQTQSQDAVTPAVSIYCGPPPVVTVQQKNLITTSSSTKINNIPTTYSLIEYRSKSTYSELNGTMGVPIASPPPNGTPSPNTQTTSILNMHAPMARRKVEWSVQQYGQVPVVPSPNIPDGNHVIERQFIGMPFVDVAADGTTPVFRIEGIYEYILKFPISYQQQLNFDIPSWLNMNFGDYALVYTRDMKPGLISSSATTPGNGTFIPTQ